MYIYQHINNSFLKTKYASIKFLKMAVNMLICNVLQVGKNNFKFSNLIKKFVPKLCACTLN